MNGAADSFLDDLIAGSGEALLHLPYTAEFDEVYGRYRTLCPREATKHDFWEAVLAKLDPENEEPVVARTTPGSSRPTTIVPPAPERLVSTPSGDQATLFDSINQHAADHHTLHSLPWTQKVNPDLTGKKLEERAKLLSRLSDSKYGSTDQEVARLLRDYPETRDSTTTLCIRYWSTVQAAIMEQHPDIDLSFLYDLKGVEDLARSKRHLQNTLQLFQGTKQVARIKKRLQQEMHEYYKASAGTLPEIHFYLDETGNESNKRYTGLGGVCVMNWQQYEMHAAALSQWRETQPPTTIHFCDVRNRPDYMKAASLLNQVKKRRGGLMFIGYGVDSSSTVEFSLAQLFISIVADAIQRIVDIGSLTEPRTVRIFKEAEPNFDSNYLCSVENQLEDMFAVRYPSLVELGGIEPAVKGSSPLLECADLVASAMKRRLEYRHRGGDKDELARTVMNVTGFEGMESDTVLYRPFALRTRTVR